MRFCRGLRHKTSCPIIEFKDISAASTLGQSDMSSTLRDLPLPAVSVMFADGLCVQLTPRFTANRDPCFDHMSDLEVFCHVNALFPGDSPALGKMRASDWLSPINLIHLFKSANGIGCHITILHSPMIQDRFTLGVVRWLSLL